MFRGLGQYRNEKTGERGHDIRGNRGDKNDPNPPLCRTELKRVGRDDLAGSRDYCKPW